MTLEFWAGKAAGVSGGCAGAECGGLEPGMGAGTGVILHPMASSASPLTWPRAALLHSGGEGGHPGSLLSMARGQGPGVSCSALGGELPSLSQDRPCGPEPPLPS